MSYATVDFDAGRPYIGRRPRGDVVLHGPGGSHGTTWSVSALVDTGADFMHLPSSAATGVGISLAGAGTVRVTTGGGVVSFQQASVDVEIEGVLVTVPVNFGPNAPALIGRQTMFAVLDKTGFTTIEWQVRLDRARSARKPAARPLEALYPLIFFDAIRIKVRDEGTVRNKAVYVALGVRPDGTKEVLRPQGSSRAKVPSSGSGS